jgi:ribonuclease HI
MVYDFIKKLFGKTMKSFSALNYTECGSAVIIYTDGACSSNGRAHAKAGVGVYFGDNHPDNISEPLLTGPHTNNRGKSVIFSYITVFI